MTRAAPHRLPDDPPPARVLAVDDDALQRLIVSEILEAPQYVVTLADGGLDALARLRAQEFDVVLLDRNLPDLSGEEVCRRLRSEPRLSLLPVLMVTGSVAAGELTAALRAGADDFIRKPYLPLELQARVDSAVQRKRVTDQLDSAEAMLFALARLVEARDASTGDHCSRLALSSVVLGQALGLSAAELRALRRGAILHDIGKLGVPDAILMKPATLTGDEWSTMRRHTVIGAQLVEGLKSLHPAAPIVRHHHERWDGSGYPDGLAGEAIPLLARVFQVVDIYDALVDARPYKAPLRHEQALTVLSDEAARGWRDPSVVSTFIDLVAAHPERLRAGVHVVDDLGDTLFRRMAPLAAAARGRPHEGDLGDPP